MIGDVSFLHDTNGLAILYQRWEIYLVVLKACVTLYSCIFFPLISYYPVSYQLHGIGNYTPLGNHPHDFCALNFPMLMYINLSV